MFYAWVYGSRMPTITTATPKQMRSHLERICATADQAANATSRNQFMGAVRRNNEHDQSADGTIAWAHGLCQLVTVEHGSTSDIVCALSPKGLRVLTGDRS